MSATILEVVAPRREHAAGRQSETTGTNANETRAGKRLARGCLELTGAIDRSCSQTHLLNWLAFTPAFRARPDNDAPCCGQVSISRRLSTGSKLRLPSTPTRAPPRAKSSGHPRSWIVSASCRCVHNRGPSQGRKLGVWNLALTTDMLAHSADLCRRH